LETTGRYVKISGASDEEKVTFALTFLTDNALHFARRIEQEGVNSWEKFETEFKKEFVTRSSKEDARHEFAMLRMTRSQTAAEFTTQFLNLARRAGYNVDPKSALLVDVYKSKLTLYLKGQVESSFGNVEIIAAISGHPLGDSDQIDLDFWMRGAIAADTRQRQQADLKKHYQLEHGGSSKDDNKKSSSSSSSSRRAHN